MQKFIFKGFKQVSYADYLAAEVKKGYLWFVRTEAGVAEDRNDDSYDIYFGEKHYGHFQAGELDAIRTSISDHLTAFNTYKTEVADAFTAVNNAITAATSSVKSYTDEEVKKEADRAKGVEAELSATISANTTAITTEKGRAEGVEAELSAAISANTTAILAEQERAISAETVNANAIVTEKERAEAAEKTLTDNLAAEIARAISAETVNANAIVTEKERAEAAEAKVLEDAKKYTDDEVTELKNYTDATFVTKEGFNEFEAEYEEKLNGIAAGAEVNVIESITVNGVDAKIAEGTKHATVTIDTKKIMHGEGETAATVSSVLEGIKTSINNINTNVLTSVVAGDGITVSEFAGNKQTISVNLYGEDNVATLKDGKLYVAPLYYDGDDAE